MNSPPKSCTPNLNDLVYISPNKCAQLCSEYMRQMQQYQVFEVIINN